MTARKKKEKQPPEPKADGKKICHLRLYVAGSSTRSLAAIANLKRFCEDHLNDEYEIEIIDLEAEPQRAREDLIVAIPTLIRKLPAPLRRIIGDLSKTDRVLVGFDMQPAGPDRGGTP